MINQAKMLEILKGVPPGSIIFVSYSAGRRPSPQALIESARAVEEGLALRHFTGKLEGVHKKGKVHWDEYYFTVWVEERDSAKNGMTPGNFRAFNPSLGRLHHLEVIQRAEPQAQ
jgi:hypothetical protein